MRVKKVLMAMLLACIPAALCFTCTPVSLGPRQWTKTSCCRRGLEGCMQRRVLQGRDVGLRGAKALGGAAEIKQTLRQYGIAALGTHFVGWVVCLSTVLAVLNAVGPENVLNILPDGIQSHIDGSKALSIVQLQVALALTEAVGPLRIGVTLTVTPRVSEVLRKYQVTRDAEAYIMRSARSVARKTSRSAKLYFEQLKYYGGVRSAAPARSFVDTRNEVP